MDFFNSEDNLRAALGKMGVNNRTMEDIMDKVRNRHYQVLNLLPLNFYVMSVGINVNSCHVSLVGMHLDI